MGFRLGGGEGDQVEGEWGKDKPKHLTRVGTNIVDTASGFIKKKLSRLHDRRCVTRIGVASRAGIRFQREQSRYIRRPTVEHYKFGGSQRLAAGNWTS